MAENTPASHAVLTGPIAGLITLEDGTVLDATPAIIYVDTPEQALDAAAKIGDHYAANGHPDDIELDEESGQLVQREFVHVTPDQLESALAETGTTDVPTEALAAAHQEG